MLKVYLALKHRLSFSLSLSHCAFIKTYSLSLSLALGTCIDTLFYCDTRPLSKVNMPTLTQVGILIGQMIHVQVNFNLPRSTKSKPPLMSINYWFIYATAQIRSRVNRWLFNILPLTTIQNLPNSKKVQTFTKCCQSCNMFYQSGEISPNLVTLQLGRRGRQPHVSSIGMESMSVEVRRRLHASTSKRRIILTCISRQVGVTRWLDYLFIIWPFKTMKIYPIA